MTEHQSVSTIYWINNHKWWVVFKDEVSPVVANITKTILNKDVKFRWILTTEDSQSLENILNTLGEQYRVVTLSPREYAELIEKKNMPLLFKTGSKEI